MTDAATPLKAGKQDPFEPAANPEETDDQSQSINIVCRAGTS